MELIKIKLDQNDRYSAVKQGDMYALEFYRDGEYSLEDNKVNIIVNSGLKVSLLVSENVNKLDLYIKENAELSLNLIKLESSSDVEINSEVERNGNYKISYIDLVSSSAKFINHVELNGEGATSLYEGAVIAKNKDNKNVEVSIKNNFPSSEGIIKSYGVSSDEANLNFRGVGQIIKGAKNSTAKQSCTMIVFDEKAKATAHPELLIAENDVVASHANAVGTVSDEIMFYLMSRGLTSKMAKQMIMLGHIKPVIESINNEEIKTKVLMALEKEAFSHA